jgi:tetratricopeptide (TPR) repeat protein
MGRCFLTDPPRQSAGQPNRQILLYVPLIALLLLSGCEYVDAGDVIVGIVEAILDAESSSDLLEEPAASEPVRSDLSGEAYLRFMKDSLDSVATKTADGDRLVRFWEERSRRATFRDDEIVALQTGLQGTHLWTAVLDSVTDAEPVRYDAARDALLLAPVELTPLMAGLLLARQLHPAWLDLTGSEVLGTDIAAFLRHSVESEEIAITLLDSLHHGKYGQLLRVGLWQKAYIEEGERIRIPTNDLTRQLDDLIGPASDYERMLRRDAYATALTLMGSRSLAERYYAMAEIEALLIPNLAFVMETEWVDHSHYHMGRDVGCRPGERVTSPLRGVVAGFVAPVTPRSHWQGIVLRGTGRDAGLMVRILGIRPTVSIGTGVDTFTVIGRAQDARDDYSDLRPYLHVELYEGGIRTDPVDWLLGATSREWRERHPFMDPQAQSELFFRHDQLLSAGLLRELAGDYGAAIRRYTEALDYPKWEDTQSEAYHYLARSQAALGDFEEATITQQALLALLEFELACSEGELPDHALGPVAACRGPDSLRLLIHNHTLNLRAYEARRQTVYIYD